MRLSAKQRLSKLQKQTLVILLGQASDYVSLRDDLVEMNKISWEREDSFKVVFSRSLGNLANKGLIDRDGHGWLISRKVFSFDSIRLSVKGRKIASRLCVKRFSF